VYAPRREGGHDDQQKGAECKIGLEKQIDCLVFSALRRSG